MGFPEIFLLLSVTSLTLGAEPTTPLEKDFKTLSEILLDLKALAQCVTDGDKKLTQTTQAQDVKNLCKSVPECVLGKSDSICDSMFNCKEFNSPFNAFCKDLDDLMEKFNDTCDAFSKDSNLVTGVNGLHAVHVDAALKILEAGKSFQALVEGAKNNEICLDTKAKTQKGSSKPQDGGGLLGGLLGPSGLVSGLVNGLLGQDGLVGSLVKTVSGLLAGLLGTVTSLLNGLLGGNLLALSRDKEPVFVLPKKVDKPVIDLPLPEIKIPEPVKPVPPIIPPIVPPILPVVPVQPVPPTGTPGSLDIGSLLNLLKALNPPAPQLSVMPSVNLEPLLRIKTMNLMKMNNILSLNHLAGANRYVQQNYQNFYSAARFNWAPWGGFRTPYC